VAVDNAGNLFVADLGNNRVRTVTSSGIISTVAGNGMQGFSGDGGKAILAQLNSPTGVVTDAAGNLFVVDHNNNRIRQVTPAGVISTVAGTGTQGFSGDGGPAISAQLNFPMGIAADKMGDLFVADYDNNRIRKISPDSSIASFFPQVVVGNGYSTLFAITNTGSITASGTLKLTNSQGEPLYATGTLTDSTGQMKSSSHGNTFPLLVPAGETFFLSAAGLTEESLVQVGWGQLESTAGLLHGTATYEYVDGSTLQALVDMSQSPLLQSATIAVDNDNSRSKQVAYAIANPGNQTIAIKLILVEQDRTVADNTVTLALGPKQQIATYLWQDFARTNFKGSLVLQGQSGAVFIAVAILDNQGLLSPIPLILGKVGKSQ
jgi:hypothetical protein